MSTDMDHERRNVSEPPPATDWHHAPVHRLGARGAYMVTCGTHHKQPFLKTPKRLSDFLAAFFSLASKHEWRLQAWSVLANHYHFIALSPDDDDYAQSLNTFVSQLHEQSSKRLNREDGVKGRRIWCNYWDTHISFHPSYFARLKYVHDNPVHHGVTDNAANYPWCSRAWLERNANSAFIRMLDGFKTDQVAIPDDF